jgi:CRP-like cAMP-binding protein
MKRRLAGQLLTGLDDAALEAILAAGRERRILANQVLFRTGEPAERLFMLVRGSIRFSRVSDSGREVVMGILASGDVCGLGSLLSEPMAYYGTAVTLEASDVIVWNQATLMRFVDAYPRLSQNALRVALNYIGHFIERQLRLVSGTADQRLAGALIRLGTRNGNPTPAGVELTITNEVLASLADVSPFTTSRAMQNWARSGAITKSRGRVRITAPERLIAS